MSEPKRPMILLLDGGKMEAKITRELPDTLSLPLERRPARFRTKQVETSEIQAPQTHILGSIKVDFAANGGYAVTLKYASPKETLLLLCKDKEDLLETLDFICPDHVYRG
jgi:hypothetical protein